MAESNEPALDEPSTSTALRCQIRKACRQGLKRACRRRFACHRKHGKEPQP
jgi:hypothetical protein